MSDANEGREDQGIVIGRRELIGVALAGGGIAASGLLPWPGAADAAMVVNAEPLTDWTIDDMWGVYPRYADPIGYGRPADLTTAAADAVDALFFA